MNEILQQRIESVQAGKNITHAQIEAKRSLREQLDSDLEAFLKNGGTVEQLAQGFSGECSKRWNGLKPKSQKTMRQVMASAVSEARARRNNPGVIAWREAKEKGLKHFNGTACITCGSTLRYTSTRSCFSCNKASSLRRAERIRKERVV